jgi:hypothetical protein
MKKYCPIRNSASLIPQRYSNTACNSGCKNKFLMKTRLILVTVEE